MEKENILIQIDEDWYFRPNGDMNKEEYYGYDSDIKDVVRAVIRNNGPIDFTVLSMYRTVRIIKGKAPWDK